MAEPPSASEQSTATFQKEQPSPSPQSEDELRHRHHLPTLIPVSPLRRMRRVGRSRDAGRAPDTHFKSEVEASSTAVLPINSNDATKASNWFEETDSDPKSKNLLGTTRVLPQGGAEQPGTYKGQAKYHSFITKTPDAPSRQVGPVKSSTNVRTITVTDFASDVCKDYKQTGFSVR